MSKYKCVHCQQVHSHFLECDDIKKLRTFVGDDEYQQMLQEKSAK